MAISFYSLDSMIYKRILVLIGIPSFAWLNIASVWLQPRGETDTGWWAAGTTTVVITTTAILANVAVMVALWRARRAPSHYPLMSLVSADLLVGVTVLPIASARELFVFNLNRIICACWSTLDVLCCTASILSICALGWERWSGITAPLCRARRTRIARRLVVSVWLVATLIALPAAFVPSPRHFHPGETEKACTVNINTGYVFFSITFSFYLPACIIVTLYVFILRALSAPPPIRAHRGCPSPRRDELGSEQKRGVKIGTSKPNENVDKNHNLDVNTTPKTCRLNSPTTNIPRGLATERVNFKSSMLFQRRATRTIVVLMALFLVCWTPYFVILPLDSLYDIVGDTTWLWCSLLGYVNSALNPFIYAVSSPSVRLALHSSLTGRRNGIPLTARIPNA